MRGAIFENLLETLGDEEKAAHYAKVSVEEFRRALKAKQEYEEENE